MIVVEFVWKVDALDDWGGAIIMMMIVMIIVVGRHKTMINNPIQGTKTYIQERF